jgi:uncharacterized protein (TIGR03437 family)
MKRLLLLGLLATAAYPYIPNPIGAPALHRLDFGNIQFLTSQNIAPGLTNAAGAVWITADSDTNTAISNSIGAWNAVATSAARFAAVQPTTLSYDPNDGKHVITFADDAYTRSYTSGILAVTRTTAFLDGTVIDTDILFSPMAEFSTTSASGTYDFQSILTHELGHALGSNHTNILSATMFWSTPTQETHQRTLDADDIAFVSTLYPAAGGTGYGTLSGVTTVSGAPLLGGALTAVDPFTGITIGGISSVSDGSFSIQVPPGNYFLYVEPATNLNLNLASTLIPIVVFTSFQTGFAGGNAQPTLFPVNSGDNITANINAAAGLTPLNVPYAAIGQAGATADNLGPFFSGSINVSSGQSVDLIFSNPLPSAPTESNIQIIGPATLRKGSLRRDAISLSNGSQVYRFTLDIPPLTANTSATLVFTSGTNILTRSGMLNLTRPQAVNAASFLGGAVAPGEILSYFAPQLGPPGPSSNGGFDASGELPTSLGGITVSFDTTQAPLFYVSGSQVNLQVPYEVAGKSYTAMTMFYNGAIVAQTTLSVAKSAPGIFVVTNADGSVNGHSAPASAGSTLVIYGTGAGVTTGLIRTGAAAPANSTIPATATLGGIPVTPVYAGLTPGSVGLTQVNVVVPAGIPAGDGIPLQFTMNGSATQTVSVSIH